MSVTLEKTVGSTDTTFLVLGPITNASGPGVLTIESEQVAYAGNSENQFFGLTRGYNSTSAVAHSAGVHITFVTNEPVGIGDLNGTAPIAVSGGTGILVGGSASISLAAATDSVNGYMTSVDHTKLSGTVPNTRTVNGHALSSNVIVTSSDVSLGNVTNVAQVPLPSVNSVAVSGSMVVDAVYIATASITLTLPTAVGFTGHLISVNTGGNTVSVNTSLSQTVNGTSSFSVPTSATFVSDGANWWTTAS